MNRPRRVLARASALSLLCCSLLAVGTSTQAVPEGAPAGPPTVARAAVSSAEDCPDGGDEGTGGCARFDEDRPLVVALDVSGSMSDEDGQGTIKLAGAQSALTQAIRNQRPGSELGLWTYPGGAADDQGCLPGSFRIPVDTLDQRSMIGAIRGMGADGETPTGPALRNLVEQLKSEGHTGATLLLVSDGLANCGEDPCDVTRQIRADGFDVTVQAAGFQISPEGLEQLRCIAEVSGGSVLEADDAADLEAVIEQFGRAELTLDITGLPAQAPAGSSTLVTATLTNNSAVDVREARVSLNFGGETSSLIPAVLPPVVSFGTIRAGASETHTWAVSYGARDKAGRAEWKAVAWGRNANPTPLSGTVKIIRGPLRLSEGGGVFPDLDEKRIAILGDSYSSGEGAGTYQPGTDVRYGNKCHKSSLTYMVPLMQDAGDVELLACSGATTRYYRGGNKDTNGVQEEQIGLLADQQAKRGAVSAGFMTVGGNDIGFSDIIAACLVGHPSNAGKLAAALNRTPGLVGVVISVSMIAATWDHRCSDDLVWKASIHESVDHLGPDLHETYRRAYNAMNQPRFVDERDGLVAPLYVLPYPQPFPERQWASYCPGFDNNEVAFANDLVDRLNARIEQTVTAMRKDRYRISFVTPVQGAFLPDHTACARPAVAPYLNPIRLDLAAATKIVDLSGTHITNQFMHPNADGYAAETDVLVAWSAVTPDPDAPAQGGTWRQGKNPSWSIPLAPSWPTVVAILTPPVPASRPLVVNAAKRTITSDPLDARGGQNVPVRVQDSAPGAVVWVSMESRRKVVGVFNLGADGSGEGVVRLPPTTAAGGHRLTVLTFDASGNPVTVSQEIDVARAIPFWLAPLAVLTLLCAAAAAFLTRRDRLRRARA